MFSNLKLNSSKLIKAAYVSLKRNNTCICVIEQLAGPAPPPPLCGKGLEVPASAPNAGLFCSLWCDHSRQEAEPYFPHRWNQGAPSWGSSTVLQAWDISPLQPPAPSTALSRSVKQHPFHQARGRLQTTWFLHSSGQLPNFPSDPKAGDCQPGQSHPWPSTICALQGFRPSTVWFSYLDFLVSFLPLVTWYVLCSFCENDFFKTGA